MYNRKGLPVGRPFFAALLALDIEIHVHDFLDCFGIVVDKSFTPVFDSRIFLGEQEVGGCQSALR